MATPEQRADTDDPSLIAVHARLQKFFTIDDPGLIRLQEELEADREAFFSDHLYLAASLSHQIPVPFTEEHITAIIGVTEAPRKQQVLRDLATELGLSISFTTSRTDESVIHKWRRNDPDYPTDYAQRVAVAKHSTQRTRTASIALDTVSMNDFPIEKPLNAIEAKNYILSLRNRSFTSNTGISFFVPTRSGRFISLAQHVWVKLQARDFTVAEAEDYVATYQPNILKIAGGVDLSHALARELFLKQDTPVIVSVTGSWGSRNITIEYSEIAALDSYFFGAPIHPIRALLAVLPALYSRALNTH